MYKLILMYSLLQAPGYPLQFSDEVTGFRSLEHCQAWGMVSIEGRMKMDNYIAGGFKCVKDSK